MEDIETPDVMADISARQIAALHERYMLAQTVEENSHRVSCT